MKHSVYSKSVCIDLASTSTNLSYYKSVYTVCTHYIME